VIGVTAPTYSIVVPVCDEEGSLPELERRLLAVMEKLDAPSEVILVDDGSTDASARLLAEMSERDARFTSIQLSRNFGHQAAITAGLDFARGQAVVVLDADLQDPPEVILEMAARWRDGYEVVYAIREERLGESTFKRLTASSFYGALRKLSDVDAPADVGDFRLVDRAALEAFKLMRERNRYVRGMFGWIGFRQIGVRYTRAERIAGRTKYPFSQMVKLATDAIIGFSTAPLRFALKLGFVLSSLSILGALSAIVLKFTGAYTVPGWASLIVAVAFLGGVQLLMLGVVGEYVARIHDEVRGRPLYLVRETHGLGDDERSQRSRGLERPVSEGESSLEGTTSAHRA